MRAHLGAPILHFATHGVVREDTPLLSAVLLAHGEALSVEDFMGLSLNGALVVLSACQTGLGAGGGGNEIIGLTRGLLAAGARAAIVSLWPVEDAATAVLMGELYRRIRAGASPVDALRCAQNHVRLLSGDDFDRELRDIEAPRGERRVMTVPPMEDAGGAFAHPYFWAPFIFVGMA
ncbi:TPR repeat protein [Minicystis rosea]|nr:TPR repeat protein [Minicystis rosea]